MDKGTSRELQTLESEKKMAQMALKGHQYALAEQLKGSMGKDMKDVLDGKKQVKFSLWKRIKNSFNRFLWQLNLVQ